MEQKKETVANERSSDLESVIKRILDIDRKARMVTAEAQNLRLQAEQNIIDQKSALKEKYRKEAEHRIEAVRADEQRMADEALARSLQDQQDKLEQLNQAFAQKGDQWAEEVFQRAIEA